MIFKIKSIAAFVGVTMLTTTLNANAGMKDLFDSYQNDLGYRQVDVAGGNNWGLGQFSARWSQPNIDVLSVQSPTVSVGCGGVDMFAGSFGLISGDELVQVGRAVAQGAASYFFKLAINNICSTCAAEMENLQNKIQRLNELARNACQGTQDLLSQQNLFGEDKAMAQDSLIGSKLASLNGTISAWETSIIGDSNTGESKDVNSRKEAIEVNSVYQSVDLLDSGASIPFLQALNFVGDTQKKKIASMLMTFIGAKVLKFADGETDPNAEPSINLTQAANYRDFILGSVPVPVDIKKCGVETPTPSGDFRCLNIVSQQVDYKPLQQVILEKLVGSPTNAGILSKYMTQTPLNASEKRFVKAFTFPYVKWAVVAKKYEINIDDIAHYAAYTLIAKINNEIFNQVSKVYALISSTKLNVYKSGTSFKEEFEKSFFEFREQYDLVRKQINDENKKLATNLGTVVQIAALTRLSRGE
ncbi:conjugal transfer protein TraH [Pseudoalteromonas sp. SK20]|uniref:conjugal transfer protein TraH n=1 Tax=Pseudoalteromonas sp. SK20 TaxID=1938367 RepID=UPI00097826BA|nr:conjugal transfer protein TraH [Pseudoalteromonas sp. SK20]